MGPPASPPHDGTPVPSAFEGENYLHLHRLGLGVPSESLIFTPQTSGTLKLSFMANTGSTGTQWGFVLLRDGAAGDGLQLDFQGHATFLGAKGVYAYEGGSGTNFKADWDDDVWKRVDIEYTLGATTATLTVDGGTPVPFLSISNAPITSISELHFATASPYDQEFNIDAVPEPATMVLLSLGGLGLLRRRKA